jgi:hypothetical protein
VVVQVADDNTVSVVNRLSKRLPRAVTRTINSSWAVHNHAFYFLGKQCSGKVRVFSLPLAQDGRSQYCDVSLNEAAWCERIWVTETCFVLETRIPWSHTNQVQIFDFSP